MAFFFGSTAENVVLGIDADQQFVEVGFLCGICDRNSVHRAGLGFRGGKGRSRVRVRMVRVG